jgi:hypothetical protein
MSDTTVVVVDDHDDDDDERGIWGRLELIAAIILGVAGILTAYAAFQGALEDGDSLDKYTESATLTADANGYYSDGKAQESQDLSVWTQWAILNSTGQEELAEAIKNNLFSEQLVTAHEEWLTIPDETSPPTPLDMDQYQESIPAYLDGDTTTAEAEQAFADAQKANEDGDKFELASVFLAIALFFAGIATLFKDRPVKLGMLAGSVILILPGLWAIADGKGWL